MNNESFILINDNVRNSAMERLLSIVCDGKTKITISASGSKSSAQRGLEWKWYTEVSKAGIGGVHEDTKKGVHLVSKYRWCVPILIRDDANFAELWSAWFDKYVGKEPKRIEWFVDTQVHTEKLNMSQMAEYLTEFQNHYLSLGVQLTNPDDYGLKEAV